MANANDFLNELKGANIQLVAVNAHLVDTNTRLDTVNSHLVDTNSRLDDVKVKLDAIKAATDAVKKAVDQVDNTLQWGFTQLITIGNYTNQALAQNDKQNDTMICILEHISKNTCELLDEADMQTRLQIDMDKNTSLLADLFAATHAEAALTREREEALRNQIEQCCPPRIPDPPCSYEPCDAPKPIGDPPRVDPQPPHEG